MTLRLAVVLAASFFLAGSSLAAPAQGGGPSKPRFQFAHPRRTQVNKRQPVHGLKPESSGKAAARVKPKAQTQWLRQVKAPAPKK